MNHLPNLSLTHLLCLICQDYLCLPSNAHCGHAFCNRCIHQYLLYAKICPSCSVQIRHREIHQIAILGQFVERFLKTEPMEIQRYEGRKLQEKKYLRGRSLRNVRIGLKVDIRDENYIWNRGMVSRMFGKAGEENRYLKIVYLDYLEKKQQQLLYNSWRLASQGFYTSRKQIPCYSHQKINALIHQIGP